VTKYVKRLDMEKRGRCGEFLGWSKKFGGAEGDSRTPPRLATLSQSYQLG